jgi:four helix bundle protein
MEKVKIHSFTDLDCWKEGHKLVMMIYQIVRDFPQKELYILTAQILRAAISITSNIAEGFSRRTKPDKRQFYYQALGSLTELQNQLLIARDLKYLQNDKFHEVADQTIVVAKLIRSLIKYVES